MSGPPPPAPATRVGRAIAWASLLLAASNVASRALGLLRDIAISGLAGATADTDAYNAAFRLPDLLNHLVLGGAMSLAFLPLYVKRQTERGEAAAAHLLRTVLGTLTAAMAAGALGAWVFAEALVGWLFAGFAPETRALTVEITRIVLPAQILFAAGGVINATLLARNRFAALALAPLVYNLCIIGVGVAFYDALGMRSFAWGVIVGATLGNFAIPLLDALGQRVRLGLRVAPLDPDFRRYLWIALPFLIGVSLLTVDEWYHSIVGSRLAEGSVSHLSYARKLMLVPVGVIGQAISTAAMPVLSRLWAEQRVQELGRVVQQTLETALFGAVVIATGTALLAPWLVTAIFQRGAFTPEDSAAVSRVLVLFSIAIPAWIAVQIGVRPFHARGDTWRPMLLQTAIAASAFPLYLQGAERAGVSGLALASTTAMCVNALAILGFARTRHGAPQLSRLLPCVLRACIAGALAAATTAAALHGVWGPAIWSGTQLAAWFGAPAAAPGDAPGALGSLARLALAGPLYLGVAFLATPLLGSPELRAQFRRQLSRRTRSARI